MLDAIARHRCTIFSGVPTMYYALLQADLAGRDLSSLRVGISGGAAIPGEVIRAFEEKFPGVVILEGYGLSETASTTTFNVSAEQRKVLSIGKPIWGVEVRVVDEQDKPLPPGPGEHRRDRHPRPQRDEGLLRQPRGDRGGVPRRLVPHRRPGLRRRGRLPVHRGPQEGHGDPRRLQRLPAGDRGGAVRPPGGGRGRRHRQARPAAGRGGRRVRRAQAGRARPARTTSSRTAGSGWRPTSTRATCGSPPTCRRGRPGRSSRGSCGPE